MHQNAIKIKQKPTAGMNHGGPPQFPRVGVHRHSILINMTDRSCKRMQMNLRKASATLTPLGAGCIANLGWNRSQKKKIESQLKEMSPLGRSTELTFKQFQTFC